MRRVGALIALLLFLSSIGIATLISLLVRGPGVGDTRPLLLLAGGVAGGAVILVVTFVSVMRRIGFPLGDIVTAADHVAEGDFAARVIERGPPSLRSVARAFNAMTARLQVQDQQRRYLMAEIAHELRTPLTVIQGRLEGLLDGVYPRDDARLNEVLEDTHVLARLVEDFRTLANAEGGDLTLVTEPTDPAILMHDVAKAFAADAASRQVGIQVDADGGLPLLEIDPVRIRQVLFNVVSNALRHTPAGGRVRIAARARDGLVELQVSDTGSGIAPADLPNVFNRFYKTAGSRGSGLGLTIARSLVLAHGGEIHARSDPGQGTTMTMTLPVASPS